MISRVIGIDLAKQVFHLVDIDEHGTILLCKRLSRGQVMTFSAQLPPTLIGMEVCSGAHYWARRLREHGHEIKLTAPQFVKPSVKANKNDVRDIEAIAGILRGYRSRHTNSSSPPRHEQWLSGQCIYTDGNSQRTVERLNLDRRQRANEMRQGSFRDTDEFIAVYAATVLQSIFHPHRYLGREAVKRRIHRCTNSRGKTRI